MLHRSFEILYRSIYKWLVRVDVDTKPTCCKKPSWIAELDLAHAAGFEYMLGKCDQCGAYSMNVFCVATSMTGFEPVSLTDVERMKSLTDANELKEFMRNWCEKNI